MACYHPIPAKQEAPGSSPRLWPPVGESNLAIPCGQCIGCKAQRATQWAQRCEHESSSWEHNTFVTLTYDDAHLPENGYLDASELARFFKRLRQCRTRRDRRIQGDQSSTLRYFACGEYGDTNGRPHYHAILFNAGFTGHKVAKDQWESDFLNEQWPYGKHTYGMATPAAANYIAQYTMKKQEAGIHDADGVWRPAPFLHMSTKPPIGARWLDRYKEDLQHGYLVSGTTRAPIPRTYRRRLELYHAGLAEDINIRAAAHRKTLSGESNDPDRIKAAEQIHRRRKELTEKRKL